MLFFIVFILAISRVYSTCSKPLYYHNFTNCNTSTEFLGLYSCANQGLVEESSFEGYNWINNNTIGSGRIVRATCTAPELTVFIRMKTYKDFQITLHNLNIQFIRGFDIYVDDQINDPFNCTDCLAQNISAMGNFTLRITIYAMDTNNYFLEAYINDCVKLFKYSVKFYVTGVVFEIDDSEVYEIALYDMNLKTTCPDAFDGPTELCDLSSVTSPCNWIYIPLGIGWLLVLILIILVIFIFFYIYRKWNDKETCFEYRILDETLRKLNTSKKYI